MIGVWHGIRDNKDKYVFNDDNTCFFTNKSCIFFDDLMRITIIFDDSTDTYEYEILGGKLVMVDVLGNVKELIRK